MNARTHNNNSSIYENIMITGKKLGETYSLVCMVGPQNVPFWSTADQSMAQWSAWFGLQINPTKGKHVPKPTSGFESRRLGWS